jgi:hypothetical protein
MVSMKLIQLPCHCSLPLTPSTQTHNLTVLHTDTLLLFLAAAVVVASIEKSPKPLGICTVHHECTENLKLSKSFKFSALE